MTTAPDIAEARTIVRIAINRDGISVHPPSVIVARHSIVQWNVSRLSGVPPLRLTIYFDKSPFEWRTRYVDLIDGDIESTADISDSPHLPGDYKYGVRATALRDGALIDDDDPFLVVT